MSTVMNDVQRKIYVLMIGPSLSVKGGISSVERSIMEGWLHCANCSSYRIIHLPTLVDGSKLDKIHAFLKAVFLFVFYNIKYNPLIVHVHFASRASFYRKSFFVVLSRLLRKKIVMHANGAEFHIFYDKECGFFRKIFVKRVLKMADVLVLPSENWKNYYKKIYKGKLVKIYNPVPVPALARDYERLSSQKKIVLTLGRLCSRKGTYDLIKAIPDIVSRYRNVEFWLCGDGDVEKINHNIKQEKLEEFVKVYGWLYENEKKNALIRADVFVLPSYNEGLSVAVLEAMSFALPVITTDVGGISEIIRHGENGLLVQPGDIGMFSNYLVSLLEDSDLRRRIGLSARQSAIAMFSEESVVERLSEVYDGLLK